MIFLGSPCIKNLVCLCHIGIYFILFCHYWMLRGPRSTRPQQPPPQSWHQDPDRPSIVSATELKELDNLDTDTDEGWAGL